MPIETVTDHLDQRLVDFHNVPDPVLLREKGLFVAESRLVVRAPVSYTHLTLPTILLV